MQGAASCAGCIIRNSYIPTLLSLWEKDHQERLLNKVVKGHPRYHRLAIDQSWKRLQTSGDWYTTPHKLGMQVPSYSDIEKHFKGQGG